jgi:hypothetical protein
VFFVLALYSANVDEVSPSQIVIPLISAISFALLVLLLSLLFVGLIGKQRKPQDSTQSYEIWNFKKVAIVASIFLVLFLREVIDALLSRSEIPPIIILQADEGPYAGGEKEWRNTDFSRATDAQIRQKMGILNAYYFPNIDTDLLYPSITPVNSFRLVFNLYFSTHFELLPDKSYAYLNGDPVDIFEITDKLIYD